MSNVESAGPDLSHYPELEQESAGWQHQFQNNALEDKTILVTGAGDGIGRATAKTYASFGANVILLGRTRQKLEAVFDWIEQNTQTSPVIVPCDLELINEKTTINLAHSIAESYQKLDGIVHHASHLGPKVPIAHYPEDEWRKTMQINAYAVFLLNKGLFDLLEKSTQAKVIHTSSSVGRQARAYWGAYAASKFALEGLSQLFADETEIAGKISVYSVNPGATRTAMRRAAYPLEDPASLPPPEAHMELYLALMSPRGKISGRAISFTSGQKLDARTWLESSD
jgi:NAD(P)-dependent dehydrogenase (short-subunit alcohol dehydrogenase family)